MFSDRLLVVDDHPIVCDAFAKYLEQVGSQVAATPLHVTCVFTLTDAIKSITADTERPDLVFLDLNLDAQNKSIATLDNFQKNNPHQVPVVIFTGLSLRPPPMQPLALTDASSENCSGVQIFGLKPCPRPR
jgi:CheY-like chemotaxis protein